MNRSRVNLPVPCSNVDLGRTAGRTQSQTHLIGNEASRTMDHQTTQLREQPQQVMTVADWICTQLERFDEQPLGRN